MANNVGESCTPIVSVVRRLVGQNCVIRNNLPGTGITRHYGGGIYCQGDTVGIHNTLISGHTGAGSGGGVAANVTNLLVQNCEFTGNLATNSAYPERGGGAMYVNSDSSTGSIQQGKPATSSARDGRNKGAPGGGNALW